MIDTWEIDTTEGQRLQAAIDKATTDWEKGFVDSVSDQFAKRGDLSDKQWAIVDRIAASSPKPIPPVAADVVVADLYEHILSARHAGIKWPKLRLQDGQNRPVVLSLSGPSARVPDSVNVTDGRSFGDNIWYGRIVDGTFQPSRHSDPEIVSLLVALDQNPLDAVKVQGQRTGNCCCCGRELTNSVSIELGIGPICRKRWNY